MGIKKNLSSSDLFGGLLGIGSSVISAIANGVMQNKTNRLNREMNAENNRLAINEADKQRNYENPVAQVSRLRAAGMSKAGALNAINGAGGYTPAPVNASQDVAPQVDLSGVANAAMGMMQLKEQRRQFDAQLEEDKRQFDATFGEEQLNNIKARELTDAQIDHLAKQNEVSDAQIKQITANTDLTWQEIQNKMAEYDLTVAQTAKLVEETKLTTEQILQVKASTRLTNAQVETEFEKKKLTEQQVKTMSKEYERLAQEVDEFMSDQSKFSRSRLRDLEVSLKDYAEKMADLGYRRESFDWSVESSVNDATGNVLPAWHYIISSLLPTKDLKGLVSVGK